MGLADKVKNHELAEWELSLYQAVEINNALGHYSAGELDGKLERMTGHGATKPNRVRFPNRPDKNRRIEISLVLDVSKEDLARYR
jgi:flagellar motor protein MotB